MRGRRSSATSFIDSLLGHCKHLKSEFFFFCITHLNQHSARGSLAYQGRQPLYKLFNLLQQFLLLETQSMFFFPHNPQCDRGLEEILAVKKCEASYTSSCFRINSHSTMLISKLWKKPEYKIIIKKCKNPRGMIFSLDFRLFSCRGVRRRNNLCQKSFNTKFLVAKSFTGGLFFFFTIYQ